MNLGQVILHALNYQAVIGCQFDKEALNDEVIKICEEHNIDIDDIVTEIEQNKDGHLDIF